MSYWDGLRKKLRGQTARRRTLIYALGVLWLIGLTWWLVSFRSRPSASPSAQVQPSPLRRVAQRVPASPPTPKLQISGIMQTGQVVEVRGSAECDATLMINGERVPLIFDQCGFKHFLLLPEGPATIAVTAQGPAGGVNTQLIKVNIE